MTEMVHQILEPYLKSHHIAIDFTMGQGYDTLFLAQHVQEVYAFDIAEEALLKTRDRLSKHHMDHVVLIQSSHHVFDQYIQDYDIGIFNLGYLPHGKNYQPTLLETTKIALEKACLYLRPKGILVCVVYPGHKEGQEESRCIDQMMLSLSKESYQVACFKMVNIPEAPYVYFIEKKRVQS